MYLEANTIFDNRYRLVQMLGQGASAQVWLAEDTLTNNLRVAIKIFNAQQSELDSYGRQDFQKEFTTVYNINHQNLLTPTNYSLNDGIPYLVLPYCENGSVSSMMGRCDEKDIIKLLHDVAAGLEYLHQHNVIHQDIKPDNIMLDDDLNYLVSDFGISTGRDQIGDTFGGTRAYMAPERFSGVSDAKGDVWALGATAYEMITGNAPFGDHGGLVQAQGEPVPPMDKPGLSPDFVRLIDSMLDADPARRPTTDQVRRITERVLETGSWKEKKGDRTLKIGGIVIALIAIAAGFFAWGMIRTKTYYYSDYVEVNGAPIGIGALTGSEQRARNTSYRIQTKGGKITRVSLVNGQGKIVDYVDSENLGVRFPDQEYHYGSNGRVEYMIARNPHGKVLYKFSYSDKGNTVSFHYDDEKNSPKFFSGTQARTVASADDPISANTTSNIAHMFLEYDSDGRLVERQYLSLLKQPTPDVNGAYGERYKYDEEGRVTEVMAIDRDGNPVSDDKGTAIRRYKYDDNGNRIEVSFFAPDGNPAQEGHNIHMARLEYDDNGNLIKETYYNGNEDPVPGAVSGAFGYEYTYGDNGFRSTMTVIDADGEPMFSNDGYVTIAYEDDGNGFNARISLLDDEGKPTYGQLEGILTSGRRTTHGPTGLPLEMTLLDDEGNPFENEYGIATARMEYNDHGDILVNETFNAEGKPKGTNANNSRVTYEYDTFGRATSLQNFDGDGNPTVNENGICQVAISYSPYGSIEETRQLDVKGNLADDRSGIARHTLEYDDQGRMITEAFYSADGKLTASGDFARAVYGYDLKSARLNQVQYYNASNQLTSTRHTTIDPSTGQLATMWSTGSNGQLLPGTAKLHYAYNDMGKQISVKATDLSDKPVNASLVESEDPSDLVTAHEMKIVYDANGNITEITYWNAAGSPAAANDGSHRRVMKYDNRGRRIKHYNYQASGSPITVGINVPEFHFTYDNRNNIIEAAAFDGNGNPITNSNGFHRRTDTYDRHGNIESEAYYSTSGSLVNIPGAFNSAKVVITYNEHNNMLEQKYYTADGKLAHVIKYTYNDKGVNNGQQIFDGSGNLDDSIAGFSTLEVKIAADGYTPLTARGLNKSKQTIASFTWDKKAGNWTVGNAPAAQDTASPATESGNRGGDPSWMANVRKQASSCPREIMDGMVMRSITATPTSVTITIVMKTISGNNYNRSEVAEIGNDYVAFPHNYLGVPNSVACHVKVLNRENKVIYSR